MIGIAGFTGPAQAEAGDILLRMLAAMSHRGAVRFQFAGDEIHFGIAAREGDPIGAVAVGDGLLGIDGWMRPAPATAGGLAPALASAHGEFAAVAWEARSRRLTIARDAMGVRPFYFAPVRGGGLAFASEIKALLAHPGVTRAVDVSAVPEFLGYRYTSGAATLWRDIAAVEPGHVCVWTDGRLADSTHWELPYERTRGGGSARDWAARAEAALREAARECAAQTARTGVLLSGGLDSSLVCALMSDPPRSAIASWAAGSEDPALDETGRAAIVARALGTRHEAMPVSGRDYAGAFVEAIAANDQPLHHPNGAALLLLARRAARACDALVMGEGADSSFGNRAAVKVRLAELVRTAIPTAASRAALAAVAASGWRHAGALAELLRIAPDEFGIRANLFTGAALVRELTGADREDSVFASRRRYFEEGAGLPAIARILRYFQRTELLASLDEFGKMLAAAGVEPRMPFASRGVQEVTCRIPPARKASLRGTAKPLLRRIARRHLPAEVLQWPKLGFGYPIGAWLRKHGPLAPYVALLQRPDARTRSLLDPAVLQRVIDENERGVGGHGEGALFAAVNLEVWMRACVEGRSAAEIRAEAEAS